jgi:hypothetical protein
MRDPVIDANGHTFDRSAIESCLVNRPGICPLTNELYPNGDARLTPNRLVRNMIDEFNKTVGEAAYALVQYTQNKIKQVFDASAYFGYQGWFGICLLAPYL